MAIRELALNWAERLGNPLMRVGGVLLTFGALAFIFSSWHHIAEIGLPSLLAFASFTGLALAIGHWLGGPDEGHRSSLAVSCATRHIGLALLSRCGRKADSFLPSHLANLDHRGNLHSG